MAAGRIASSRATSKRRPAGWTVTVKVMIRRRIRDGSADCARRQCPPRPTPLPAPPARCRRPTLLIVGCGDVGLRVLRLLRGALARARADLVGRARAGACAPPGRVPLRRRPRRPGHAGPPGRAGRRGAAPGAAASRTGDDDPRTAALLQALARGGARAAPGLRQHQRRLRRLRRRAHRRDARRAAGTRRARGAASMPRRACATSAAPSACACSVLRVPGIYAARPRRRRPARARCARHAGAACASDDVYTNHIHADDLARACVAALLRGAPQRVYHVSDDSELRMGELLRPASPMLCGLPRPPRLPRADARGAVSPMQLSFMGESRRLDNPRLKRELRAARCAIRRRRRPGPRRG